MVRVKSRAWSFKSPAEAGPGAGGTGAQSRVTPLAPAFSIVLPGELLEESQMEASRLRQKAEELVKDSEQLPPPSPSLASFDHLTELTGPKGARVVLCLPCARDP